MKEYNILHVEDLRSDADLIKKLIQSAGIPCRYVVVDSKEEFMEELAGFKPDLILSDHTLPMFNSKMAFKMAREKYPNIPFILVTGTVSEEFAVDMIQRGIDDYLLKTNLRRLPVAILHAFAKRENEEKLKKVQSDLLQSEMHLRSIFNNSTIGLILLDNRGNILELNNLQHYCKAIDFCSSLKKGDNMLVSVPPGKRQDLNAKFIHVLQGNEVNFEDAYEDENGTTTIFTISLNPVYNPQKQVSGVCMGFEDITKRKNHEQELVDSELFSRSILTSISSPISVVDDNGYILEVNEAWKKFALNNGQANIRHSGKGSNYVDVCKKAVGSGDMVAAKALQGFHRVSRKEIPFFQMIYPCHSPTEERWFQMTITKFVGQSGKVVMKHTDITQLTNASKEAADYKNALTESSILAITDDKGIIKQVNENFCKISQFSARELIGNSLQIVDAADHPGCFQKQLWQAVQIGKIWQGEICIKAKDGRIFWVDTTIVPSLNDQGIAVQCIAIAYDITTRKQSETRIAEAIERYDMLSHATSNTTWDWDVVNDVMVYNEGISNIFGYDEERITNTMAWWYDQLHPDDLESVVQSLQDSFQKEQQLIQLSFRFRCAAGVYKHIFNRGFAIFDQLGKPVRMIGAMQDVTYEKAEEMRVAKSIIDAQEQERQLLGAELHDNINQILAASLLSLGMAKTIQADASRQIHFMDSALDYITKAIDETRKLSHKLAPASFAGIPLAELFKNLLAGLNPDGRFTITLDFDRAFEKALSEEIKTNLYRILQEQSKNIVKYANAGAIEVAVTLSDNNVKLRIQDDGVGFDPTGNITGIGLSNIKKRAASLHGKCMLHSAPGMGCELIVELPLG